LAGFCGRAAYCSVCAGGTLPDIDHYATNAAGSKRETIVSKSDEALFLRGFVCSEAGITTGKQAVSEGEREKGRSRECAGGRSQLQREIQSQPAAAQYERLREKLTKEMHLGQPGAGTN